jgi:hypothetical protein
VSGRPQLEHQLDLVLHAPGELRAMVRRLERTHHRAADIRAIIGRHTGVTISCRTLERLRARWRALDTAERTG